MNRILVALVSKGREVQDPGPFCYTILWWKGKDRMRERETKEVLFKRNPLP
jgi:hypothetical protein